MQATLYVDRSEPVGGAGADALAAVVFGRQGVGYGDHVTYDGRDYRIVVATPTTDAAYGRARFRVTAVRPAIFRALRSAEGAAMGMPEPGTWRSAPSVTV